MIPVFNSCFILLFLSRGSVFDKIEEEEEEEDGDGNDGGEGESFKTDIEVEDRTYSVGNESSLNDGLRSRVRALHILNPPNICMTFMQLNYPCVLPR